MRSSCEGMNVFVPSQSHSPSCETNPPTGGESRCQQEILFRLPDGRVRLAYLKSSPAVSIGYPGPILRGRPGAEPKNLGGGWVGFDFERAFGCPLRGINDAAMQALGSYREGRMLFLGLGTGLGSALIIDGVLEPMELAHLPYKNGRSYEAYVGVRGLKRFGKKKWRRHVAKAPKRSATHCKPSLSCSVAATSKSSRKFPRVYDWKAMPTRPSGDIATGRIEPW
jgi:hypothetical protein